LGSDPMILGQEQSTQDYDDDYDDDDDDDYDLDGQQAEESTSSFTSSGSKTPPLHREHEPIGIQPLYQEEPTTTIRIQHTPSRAIIPQHYHQPTPTNNYSSSITEKKRSKDVLQLQLAMEKQTEFDSQHRDMDHRLHCYSTPKPQNKRRSGSNSAVPGVIAISSDVLTQESKKRKAPPSRSNTSGSFSSSMGTGGTSPTASRGPSVSPPPPPPPPANPSPNKGQPSKKKSKATKLAKSKSDKKPKPSKSSNKANNTKKIVIEGGPSPTSNKAAAAKPTTDEDDDNSEDIRFRRYQNNQWNSKFEELMDFKTVTGHCQVPHSWPSNPQLARWVKRQRYQFKLRCEGKSSTMTEDRIQLLEEVGFVWDSHAAAWQEKYLEIVEFVNEHDTNGATCGSNFNLSATNPQLATWVKCQRRQYKLLKEGKESNMTPERKGLLEDLGFLWGVQYRDTTNKRTT